MRVSGVCQSVVIRSLRRGAAAATRINLAPRSCPSGSVVQQRAGNIRSPRAIAASVMVSPLSVRHLVAGPASLTRAQAVVHTYGGTAPTIPDETLMLRNRCERG